MKTFCKYYEKGKFLLEHSNGYESYNILIHWGDKEIFWYRIRRGVVGYFELCIGGRRILGWDIKTNEQ